MVRAVPQPDLPAYGHATCQPPFQGGFQRLLIEKTGSRWLFTTVDLGVQGSKVFFGCTKASVELASDM